MQINTSHSKTYEATAQCEAFERRYGKKISAQATANFYKDNSYQSVILTIQSAKSKYILSEHFREDGSTDYVLLYKPDEPNRAGTKFDRYIDAEVTLADLIAGE